ncbi:hypothetical protein ACHAXT_002664, partial [Thalassiosira profunda]
AYYFRGGRLLLGQYVVSEWRPFQAASGKTDVHPDGSTFPFSGTYSCGTPHLAYAASWLVHRDKFVRTVRFGSWWTTDFDPSDDMKRPGWQVGTNVTFKPGLNMEGASDIVLDGHASKSRPRKTKDLFDFAVEHLSVYEHVSRLKSTLNAPQGQQMLREWTTALQRRVDHLRRGWAPGIDASGGEGNSTVAALNEQVVAAIPFYLNIDGGGGYQSGSVHHTRRLYLNATYFSISRVFPNVVAFVSTPADYSYCKNESGLPFHDVVFVRGLSKGTELPMATLLEVQRRFRTNHDGWKDKFRWLYYTESDQVLRLRGHQLQQILNQVPAGADDAVLVPHRMVTWPTSKEYVDFPGNLSEATAARFQRLGSKNVTLVDDPSQIRCCMESSAQWCQGKTDFKQWTAPYDEEDGPKDRPPIHLLQAGKGSYYLLNGWCHKFEERCWTCAILTAPNATCTEEVDSRTARIMPRNNFGRVPNQNSKIQILGRRAKGGARQRRAPRVPWPRRHSGLQIDPPHPWRRWYSAMAPDNELVAPRPLSERDLAALRALVAGQLNVAGSPASQEEEEDARDLIDYAVDMVKRGKNVGSAVEELEFMQYDICDAAVAQNIGKCLAAFFKEMKTERGLPAASRKASREIRHQLSSGSSDSPAQLAKRDIYDDCGVLVKQWAGKVPGSLGGEEGGQSHFSHIGPYRRKSSGGGSVSSPGSPGYGYGDDEVLKDVGTTAKGLYDDQGNLTAAWTTKYKKDSEGSYRPVVLTECITSEVSAAQRSKRAMYNEKGEIVGGDSSVKERPRHNPGVDLSTKGTLRKKSEELDAIRETGTQRRGVKGNIYSADGKLTAAWKKLEGRDPFAEERELLRAAGNEKNVVESMYNEKGEIVGGDSSVKERPRHNPGVDLSTKGTLRKKSEELDAIRESGTQRRGVKGNIYSADGKLTAAWKKLEGRDPFAEERELLLASGNEKLTREVQAIQTGAVDYRATVAPRKLGDGEASTLRSLLTSKLRIPNENYKEDASDLLDYALDMVAGGYNVGHVVKEVSNLLLFMDMPVLDEDLADDFAQYLAAFLLSLGGDVALATRSKRSIYDQEGILKTQWANVTELKEEEERRIDLSAMAAAQKQGREMEDTLLAERVSAKERSKLDMYDSRGQLRKQWAERADDLYEDDMNLSAEAASKRAGREVHSVVTKSGGLGDRLAKYKDFVKPRVHLHHEGDDHDEARLQGLQRLTSGNSAHMQARKTEAEMRATLLASEAHAAQRGKQGIYSEDGVLVKQWAKVKEEDSCLPNTGFEPRPQSMELQRKRTAELQAVMRDRSLSKDERAARIEEVKAKYASGPPPVDGGEQKEGPATCSALAFSRKASREVQAMDKEAKERSKKENYDSQGVLKKQWEKVDLKEIEDVDAYADEQRKLEFQRLNDEQNLRERIARRDMLKAQQKAEQEEAQAKARGQRFTSGNSAHVQARKTTEELQATLSGVSAAQRGKHGIYSEDGVLVKQWANVKGEDETSGENQGSGANQAEDKQRREELQSIMRDSSLSKEERHQRIEEVKAKYAGASVSADESSAYTGNLKVVENKELDEMRKKEFSALMRDRSLSREERSRRMEEIKKKYSTGSSVAPPQETDSQEEQRLTSGNSAHMQARKTEAEMKATLLASEAHAAERGKRSIYAESGVLVQQWASVMEDDDGGEQAHLPESNAKSEPSELQRKRTAELQAVMRDRSLSKDERAARIEEVKAKYGGNPATAPSKDNAQKGMRRLTSANSAKMQARKASQEVQAMDKGAKERSKKVNYSDEGVLVKQWNQVDLKEVDDIDAHIDEQRKLYFQQLNEEQARQERIARKEQLLAERKAEEEAQAKQGLQRLTSGNSAHKQASKQAEDVQATLAGTNAAQRSKQGIYSEDGVLVKQWANVKEDEEADEKSSDFKTFMSKSLDEQRREELNKIMRDRSLHKDERAERIEEVKAKYAAIAEGRPAPLKKTTCNTLGVSEELDDQRRRELRAIMKDHSLDRDEKNRRLEEVKLKYDAMEPNQEEESDAVEAEEEESEATDAVQKDCADSNPEPGSLDVQRNRKEELQAIMRDRSLTKEVRAARIDEVKAKYAGDAPLDSPEVKEEEAIGVEDDDVAAPEAIAKPPSSKGSRVKERMAAFNSKTFVPNYDPVAFAVSKNKAHSFKTQQAAKNEAKESASRYDYRYTG